MTGRRQGRAGWARTAAAGVMAAALGGSPPATALGGLPPAGAVPSAGAAEAAAAVPLAVSVVDRSGRAVAGARVVARCGGRLVRAEGPGSAVRGPGGPAGDEAGERGEERTRPVAGTDRLHHLRLPGPGCELWAAAPGGGFAWWAPAGGGMGPAAPAAVRRGHAAGGPPHRLVLAPAAVVELLLVDGVRGVPLARPWPSWSLLWRPGSAEAWRRVPREVMGSRPARPGGGLRLEGLAPGWYRVAVASPLHGSPPHPDLEVGPGEVGRLRVVLQPTATVCGFVDAGDLGVGGAVVRWWQADGRARGRAEVAADGAFCVGDLEAGVEVGLAALSHGIESEPVLVPAPSAGVALEVRPGAVVRGRVEEAGQAPVPGTVEIAVYVDVPPVGEAALPPLRRQRVEDAGGRFAVPLAAGPGLSYRLVFQGPGWAAEVVRVDAAEPPGDLVVELGPGTLVTGRVRAEATGEAVAGALVAAECWREDTWTVRRSAVAGEDGAVVFPAMPTGDCSLTARHPGFAPGEAGVAVDEADVEVEVDLPLSPEAALAGRVVAGDPPRPVAGAEVRVLAFDAGSPVRTARTGGRGLFRVGGLAPGRHRVEVDHPRHGRASVDLEAGRAGPEEETIRLTATLVVTGEVRASGGPVADATVLLLAGTRRLRGRTGVDGRFRFDGVPEGEVALDASVDGGTTWCPRRAVLEAPGPAHLVVDCGGGFEVRVVDQAASRSGWLALIAEGGRLFSPSARTGSTHLFRGLEPGVHRLVEVLPSARRVLWEGHLDGPTEIVVGGG